MVNKRDAFVATLKTLIAGWKFEQGQLSSSESEEFQRLQVLIAKTTVFLRDEFGDPPTNQEDVWRALTGGVK